eukprot:COSAG01_NODE_61118_length_291_cov_0.661458_1_plen_51_part_01
MNSRRSQVLQPAAILRLFRYQEAAGNLCRPRRLRSAIAVHVWCAKFHDFTI